MLYIKHAEQTVKRMMIDLEDYIWHVKFEGSTTEKIFFLLIHVTVHLAGGRNIIVNLFESIYYEFKEAKTNFIVMMRLGSQLFILIMSMYYLYNKSTLHNSYKSLSHQSQCPNRKTWNKTKSSPKTFLPVLKTKTSDSSNVYTQKYTLTLHPKIVFCLPGAGFMRLFGTYLASHGSSLGTYFRLLRPRGVTLDFREILKRVNTPFMFCLKVPGSASPAEVSDICYSKIRV